MDTYKLNDIDATVGMFADFSNFKDVIDWVFTNYPYKKALEMFSCDDIQDISEAVTNNKGQFDEDLAKEEADRLVAEAEEEKRRKEAEKAAEAAAKAQAEAARIQAEKEKSWNTGLDKINEIDAQITYTAMMTNTLLNDESDTSDNNDSSMENKTETDNTSTKEDTNNEQSNG